MKTKAFATIAAAVMYATTATSSASAPPRPVHAVNPARPAAVALPAIPGAVTVSVDVTAGRHAISDDIYGMNFADPAFARQIGLTVDRWGGDATERYNWQAGNTNTGNDYFFENVADCWTSEQQWCSLANHASYRSWMSRFDADIAGGASPLVTLPLLGYVSSSSVKYAQPLDCGYPKSVGVSASYDQYDADCGNGKTSSGSWVGGAHPSLTSTAISYDAFDGGWIDAIRNRYGNAVRFYELGNEPALWSDTHHDVRDTRLGYDEEYAKASALAAVVKQHAPNASVLGPSDWGWPAYLCSDLDNVDANGCNASSPDRKAHGGAEFAAWYLKQFAQYQAAHGVRLLDYFDEHYYPQGGSSPDITRSLWDPTYTDPSWIGAAIQLIPRMRAWIAANYPGTKIAISEYDFGHHSEQLGAVLEADALGIFGREGVSLATMWSPPAPTDAAAYAFEMYRNYDGDGARFGATGVATSSSAQSTVGAYAAMRADGTLTVMLINKTNAPHVAQLSLSAFAPSAVNGYQFTSAQTGIQTLPAQAIVHAGGSVVTTLPPMSLTLLAAK